MSRLSHSISQNDNHELCFDPNLFLKESFSIDEFLRNHRNKATLEVLRNDLGKYLKTLRLSMIDLIHKDYEDFVNLSKDLVGLNSGIEVLQGPLEQVRAEVLIVKNALEDTIAGLENCLEQDRILKEKKQSLFHLSQVIHLVKKLNVLLKAEQISAKTSSLDLIERASAEYTILQFSASNCVDVISKELKNDCDRLSNVLMGLLNNTFLECLCDRNSAQLCRCLRIYLNLDKVTEAETLIRTEVIAPYLYDLISEVSLQKQPNGLDGIYQKVLEFIDSQLSPLLTINDECALRFDFLVNGLWVELTRRMEVHMGSVFAVGDPTTFHKRFTDTVRFLEKFKKHCSAAQSLASFHDHELTGHFLQKWNLLVYYKIRFQEIAGQLEHNIQKGVITTDDNSDYYLRIPVITIMCLERCWDDQVFISQIAILFFRLSLQILSRYCLWAKEEVSQDQSDTDEISNSSLRKSRLHFLICLYLDSKRLVADASGILSSASQKLPELVEGRIEGCLRDTWESLSVATSMITERIVKLLVRQSVVHLSQVKDIPRLFRRTNREAPTKPCEYVQLLIEPVINFHQTNQPNVPEQVLDAWLVAVFSEIGRRFYDCVNEVLTSAQKTEESLRRLKKAKDKAANNTESKGITDDDKIRQQFIVDVEAFCRAVQQLNINPDEIESIKQLNQFVQTARDKSRRQ